MGQQVTSTRITTIVSDCVISPLGNSTEENFQNMLVGKSGIAFHKDITEAGVYASVLRDTQHDTIENLTLFESMAVRAIQGLQGVDEVARSRRTLFVLSTTKGNIDLLNTEKEDLRTHLHHSAKAIAGYIGNPNLPIVVSTACTSGIVSVITAARLLSAGMYDHTILVAADQVTNFVVSGFRSLYGLSESPCKPFDKSRSGINLGEAYAAVLMTVDNQQNGIRVLGGSTSNDANHISGPSRTGEELALAINRSLAEANLHPKDIDFVSAHGTATLYNDEMEAKAFGLSGLSEKPINSLKGYFGHTLGAAGLVESVLSMQSLRRNTLIPSKGFESLGVSVPLAVIQSGEKRELRYCLKTASGFGGSNAAVVFGKEE